MKIKYKSLGIAWFLGPLDRVCSQDTGQDCLDPSKVVDQGLARLTGVRKRRYRIAVMLLMPLGYHLYR